MFLSNNSLTQIELASHTDSIGSDESNMRLSQRRSNSVKKYLVDKGISVLGLTEEQEIFSGTAREACRGFPANVNVSAAVSLAGIGPDQTRIRIMAVPGLKRNCHEIDMEGEFGKLHMRIENIPTENPRTGRLTVMSIIRTLQGITDPIQIGT